MNQAQHLDRPPPPPALHDPLGAAGSGATDDTRPTMMIPAPEQMLRPVRVFHDRREDFTVYGPAGMTVRWYAFTIDLALCAPLDVLVHLPFARYLERLAAYGHNAWHTGLWVLLAVVPVMLYFITPTVLWGQTLGKKIVGVRVINASFQPKLDFTSVLVRETAGKLLGVALLGAGLLMIVFDQRKRGLHDRIAGTQVVSYRPR